MRKSPVVLLAVIILVFVMKLPATAALLHEFTGGNGDGESPSGSLLSNNAILYGMTFDGGDDNRGVIFSIGMDGSNFKLLHEFSGWADGQFPWGSLIRGNSILYGMTYQGGSHNAGVIFSMGTDGSNFTLLHEFAGVNHNGGAEPLGDLILKNSTLYGMTSVGGDSDKGVIFSMGTDGSNFTFLHEFAGGINDGAKPSGSFILSNSTLYGMTLEGGDSNKGVIFSMGTDGSNLTLLHEFAGGNNDGAVPYGTLILSNSTFYGMTYHGGDGDVGVIFSMGTDGSNFTLLHEFAGGNDDGSLPYDSLILSNSNLYGMTGYGGGSNKGVIFSMGTDGSNFTLLHEFDGPDGSRPYGSLLLENSTLYGMTKIGGGSDKGVVFSHILAPGITSFTPTSGSTGTTVTITGTNFTGATAVKFGGTDAQSYTVDSATQITAVVGTGSTGNVTVATPDGTATSASAFTYISTPTVTTTAASSITTTTASSGGNVTGDGGTPVTVRGVCWSTAANPTILDAHTTDGTGTGSFTSSVTGLSPNTTYHVRAWATNHDGTAYGSDLTFITDPQAPIVTTQAVTHIGETTATGNGNVTDLGAPNPTQHGVCWNTTGMPTIGDSKTAQGSVSATGAFTSNMTGLSPDTTYHVRAYATNTAGTVYGGQVSFITRTQAPTVTTQAVTAIGTTTATGNGNITELGAPNPTQHGVCWNTTGTPTIGDSKTAQGSVSATGTFTSDMTGLSRNTTYHVRAYATDTAGTFYGNEVSFTTHTQVPTVTTQAVTHIGETTATGNGNVTDLGAPDPTQHGVCWNTTGSPTTADSKTEEGAAHATGAFTSSMTGLSPDTTYHVRAYATDAVGTSYGNEVSFTTHTQAPTVTTQAVTAIGTTTATGNGNITELGAPNPTQHGVCWNTTGTPTIGDSKTAQGSVSAIGAFTSNMTGLSPDTTYHVRAYATNTGGTAYGNQASFTTRAQAAIVTTQAVTHIGETTATGHGNITNLGAPPPTQHGICWNTTGSPTTADSKTEEGAAHTTGVFTSNMTVLSPNTTYYVRAYATDTVGTIYGNQVSFTTGGQGPTVTTQAVRAIAKTTATGNGNITDLGAPPPTQHGVCWNTTGTPTIADSKTTDGAVAATGAFTSNITGLRPGTDYYVRAYATNMYGTSYGNQVFFISAGRVDSGKPSSYKVTVTKVQMYNQTSWVTLFSGTAQLDTVAGGTFPGIRDLSLPAGVYSRIRITFNNAFPVAGTLSHDGTAYYTTAATFEGQTNLDSTPTTVAGDMAEFTFYEPVWGALNANVTQTFTITPVTIGPGTDYQPTLRFTISPAFHLKESAGDTPGLYFSLGVPVVSLVEP